MKSSRHDALKRQNMAAGGGGGGGGGEHGYKIQHES